MKKKLLPIAFCLLVAPLLVKAQNFSISGRITTPYGLPISNAYVEFATAQSVQQIKSNDDGVFFANLPEKVTEILGVRKSDQPLNGLSVEDVYLISRHILFVQPFASPYQALAADINNSMAGLGTDCICTYRPGGVTTFDLVLLTRLLLGQDNGQIDWGWKFLSDRQVDLMPDQLFINYTGVKTGDVSGNAAPRLGLQSPRAEFRSRRPAFVVPDQAVQVGELISVPFYSDQVDQLAAFQLTLSFAPDQMSFVGVDAGELNLNLEDNIGQTELDQGKLRIVYVGDEPKTLVNEPLFELQFRVKTNSRLAQLLSFAPGPLAAKIYHLEHEAQAFHFEDLELDFDQTVQTNTVLAPQKLKVYPNPVTDHVRFVLPSPGAEPMQLSLFDASGQLKSRHWFNSRELHLTKEDLRTGLYFYQVHDHFGQQQFIGKLMVP